MKVKVVQCDSTVLNMDIECGGNGVHVEKEHEYVEE